MPAEVDDRERLHAIRYNQAEGAMDLRVGIRLEFVNRIDDESNKLYGLSRLSVWWLRLGIQIERIKPGHPEQNGQHERMHLTLKREATKPAAANLLQQQARFGAFVVR